MNQVTGPSPLRLFIKKFLNRSTTRMHEAVDLACAMMTARCVVTQEHVERVAIYADGMAEVFELAWPQRRALRIGALLHDVGKIGVRDAVLHKTDKLTLEEFDEMKLHPIIGAEIISSIDFGCPAQDPVRWHHERWGGGGYPDGLREEEIPVTARILAVVDSYDAVREDRPYRKGLTRQEAIQVLRRGAGERFDHVLVRAFIQNLHVFEREIDRQKFTPSPRMRPTLPPEAKLVVPAAGLAA